MRRTMVATLRSQAGNSERFSAAMWLTARRQPHRAQQERPVFCFHTVQSMLKHGLNHGGQPGSPNQGHVGDGTTQGWRDGSMTSLGLHSPSWGSGKAVFAFYFKCSGKSKEGFKKKRGHDSTYLKRNLWGEEWIRWGQGDSRGQAAAVEQSTKACLRYPKH